MRPGSLDETILRFVVAHRSVVATDIARAVMAAGTTPAVLGLLAVVALAVVVLYRAYRPAGAGVPAVVVAAILAAELKGAVGRARPPADLALVSPGGPSFPSTQAAETAALAVAVVVAVAWGSRAALRAATWTAGALVLLAGTCMVYLGAHWPSDVVAGWMLGGAIGAVAGWLARRWSDPGGGPVHSAERGPGHLRSRLRRVRPGDTTRRQP
ncbi:MAG TPA: phosphatase PAP2 family protein [Actinotalea sp.]